MIVTCFVCLKFCFYGTPWVRHTDSFSFHHHYEIQYVTVTPTHVSHMKLNVHYVPAQVEILSYKEKSLHIAELQF